MKQVGEEVEQYEDARTCGVICEEKLEDFARKSKFGRNFDFRTKKLKNNDGISALKTNVSEIKKNWDIR